MLFLSREQVQQCLDLDLLIDALSSAMADLSSGHASVPPRIAALVEEQNGFVGSMPAYVPSLNVLSAKLVSVFPRNTSLPTHQAVILAFDPTSGEPIALMDGTYITAVRTAAGSALATKLLSREDSKVLAILGTGVQAGTHARAIPRVRPIQEIIVAGLHAAKAAAFAEALRAELDCTVRVAISWEEASAQADIVCATTHPHEPVVRWPAIKNGTHINSVGVAPDGEEVDQETIENSSIFVEQRTVSAAPMPAGSMELFRAMESGLVSMDSLTEIGEIVLGTNMGRISDDEVTLYKSVGVGVQDAAAVSIVLEAAARLGLGTSLAL